MTIRDQLEPLIRQAGVRRVAGLAGIGPSVLSAWMNGRENRRLGDAQLERLAEALGVRLEIIRKEDDPC